MIAILAAAAALAPSYCIAPRQTLWRERRESVEIDGTTYRRLRSVELKRAIVDKLISPIPAPLIESGEWFVKDGTYGRELHRGGEIHGTYRISRDVVTIRLPDHPSVRRMYFKSSDDELATGVFNEGCMNIGRIIAKPLGN